MSELPAMTPFEVEADRRREVLVPLMTEHVQVRADAQSTGARSRMPWRGIIDVADAWLTRAVRRA